MWPFVLFIYSFYFIQSSWGTFVNQVCFALILVDLVTISRPSDSYSHRIPALPCSWGCLKFLVRRYMEINGNGIVTGVEGFEKREKRKKIGEGQLCSSLIFSTCYRNCLLSWLLFNSVVRGVTERVFSPLDKVDKDRSGLYRRGVPSPLLPLAVYRAAAGVRERFALLRH